MHDRLAPRVACEQELAFDFDGHGGVRQKGTERIARRVRGYVDARPFAGPTGERCLAPDCGNIMAPQVAPRQESAGAQRRSNSAMDSTCAVCGNMSMTPAAMRSKPWRCTSRPASRASEAG